MSLVLDPLLLFFLLPLNSRLLFAFISPCFPLLLHLDPGEMIIDSKSVTIRQLPGPEEYVTLEFGRSHPRSSFLGGVVDNPNPFELNLTLATER